ncbi:class III signal peptide-containing protein [Bacteroidota bacterium]
MKKRHQKQMVFEPFIKKRGHKHTIFGFPKTRKGQISVEYLLIIGMALAILVPGSILFYNYSKNSNEQLVASQINRIGKNIISNAEQMYTIGKNSWVTLDISFPESTTDAYIVDGSELVIKYQTTRGITESVFFTDITIEGLFSGNISNPFHSGNMKIKIESLGDRVLIGESSS